MSPPVIALSPQTVVWWIILCAPTVFLVAVGYLGELAPNWWTYLLANGGIGFVMRSFLYRYIPVLIDTHPLAFGLVIGTKLCVYYTAMVYFVPGGTLTHYYMLQVHSQLVMSRDVTAVPSVVRWRWWYHLECSLS